MSSSTNSPGQRWDRKYAASPGFDCRDPRDVVVKAVALLAPGKALDLGCGRGRNAAYLAQLGWNVTAVDVSQVALDAIDHPRITCVQADLEAGEFQIEPSAFDLIVDTFYLQHDLFPAVREGIREGGIFAAEIPIEDPQAPPMNPLYVLKPGQLSHMFAGWKIELYEESRVAEHQRMTARLIARRIG